MRRSVFRLLIVLGISINPVYCMDEVVLSTLNKQDFKVTLKLCTSIGMNSIKVEIIENNRVLKNSQVLLRTLAPLNIHSEYVKKQSNKEGNYIFSVKFDGRGKYRFLISFLTTEGVTRVFIGDFLIK